MVQGGEIRFEAEVCKLPRLANMHGLRLKRISGDVWAYKALVDQLVSHLDLAKLHNRDSTLSATPASLGVSGGQDDNSNQTKQ